MLKKNMHSAGNDLITFIKNMYGEAVTPIPLHRPVFEGSERSNLLDCIDSNFVSSVGTRVTEFEQKIATFSGSSYAIATMNGTSALHSALIVSGVEGGDEVITQALTFVATANAISYVGATPVFVDVDKDSLGMSPHALRVWLENNTITRNGSTINKNTGARIAACIPMHTFGFPMRILEVSKICESFGIVLVEDAAESLGSYVGDQHTGTFGQAAMFSFNGNKIITTGGGGIIVTNDVNFANRCKHITTTAKRPHDYDYFHDEIAFNYRLPNLNAALGVAQMEVLPNILKIKAEVAANYKNFCSNHLFNFIMPIEGAKPNNWLNAIILEDKSERDLLLEKTNSAGIMTRPIWRLMTELPMFSACQNDGLVNAHWLVERIINLPSSVPKKDFQRLKK